MGGAASRPLFPPSLSPVWHPPELAEAPQLELGTGMGVTVTRGMFGKDDGQIQWYGIIATINMSCEFCAWKGWGVRQGPWLLLRAGVVLGWE